VRSDISWTRTGHVLVMDMDLGREHHPWFVLASRWPSDIDNANGEFTAYAEEKVLCNDSTQPGVLPGGNNRTPVAKVYAPNDNDQPMPKRFGPDFHFEVVRFGGNRTYDKDMNMYGPDLPHVMEWHWDAATGEEVCFYKNGREYMRYDRTKGQYTYPEWEQLQQSVTGESGMFGTLMPPQLAMTVIPLSAPSSGIPSATSEHRRRERETCTMADF
ncbi:MAG: hypothetical protein Q9191_008487, partial [Dirinaria sp. TL-2023a]